MEMFQHDSVTMFRFVLEGEPTSDGVQELEHTWTTARSILGTKALAVELSGITSADTGSLPKCWRHESGTGKYHSYRHHAGHASGTTGSSDLVGRSSHSL